MTLELPGVLTIADAIAKVKAWVLSLGVREGDSALVEPRLEPHGSRAYAVVCRGGVSMDLEIHIHWHNPNADGVLLFALRHAGATATRI